MNDKRPFATINRQQVRQRLENTILGEGIQQSVDELERLRETATVLAQSLNRRQQSRFHRNVSTARRLTAPWTLLPVLP